MKQGLRILGVLLILGSIPCLWRFQAEMAKVQLAVDDARRAASYQDQQYKAAKTRESAHRATARDWSLSGLGAVVVGLGLVGYSWLGRKRGLEPVTGANV